MANVAGLFVSPARGSGRSEPRSAVVAVENWGLEGCAHASRPRKEILLASKQHLDALAVEPGAIRENITIDGADVQAWPAGQRLQIGTAVLEITQECAPCHRMDELRAGLRTLLQGNRGMYARVVEGGEIALGDEVDLV